MFVELRVESPSLTMPLADGRGGPLLMDGVTELTGASGYDFFTE
jgi:hypothetical protein